MTPHEIELSGNSGQLTLFSSSRVLLQRACAPSRSGVAGRFFDQKTKNETWHTSKKRPTWKN